ncbi:helix-turn-helix domain-containing protein [Paenibacillus sp. N3/727]|uniref:helix-turn-helix domain-containing protein n=1 Tax=Paenibacillus sp. N3/727 TaxID=2925845 RepID=UPI001F537B61|nr:helix-turn-helix domain-containing protein [Paenibacillus sp. N3/727]UNK20793.1 helix-turn-helix domain-containing protein [Paenibacillus sp. N3/727]
MQHIKVPYALLDLDVSIQCKMVYMALMKVRSGRRKQIKVKMDTIAKNAGLQNRQTSTHIATLCRHNVISKKQINYEGHYGCNIYRIVCDESKFAQLPYPIAWHEQLTAYDKIAYCVIKRYTDLNKGNYTSYLSKKQLSVMLKCSPNQVDKIKARLRKAGFISYTHNSKEIVLIFERDLNAE